APGKELANTCARHRGRQLELLHVRVADSGAAVTFSGVGRGVLSRELSAWKSRQLLEELLALLDVGRALGAAARRHERCGDGGHRYPYGQSHDRRSLCWA